MSQQIAMSPIRAHCCYRLELSEDFSMGHASVQTNQACVIAVIFFATSPAANVEGARRRAEVLESQCEETLRCEETCAEVLESQVRGESRAEVLVRVRCEETCAEVLVRVRCEETCAEVSCHC
ncbi:hypothetical protein CYMTET_20689 [Cymbomonas tetramitiformis]|uniref:Uncharacterized protein n=1 Tax=Cymbomonas tetramitiformis TaxID=36881 RepID=A0AAE0G3J1_9CHLO|nr:hypothetical protein CYMTET_20689 [Cymbomonas tetramitiformis]